LDSLQKHYKESSTKSEFGKRYISYLTGLLAGLDMGIVASIIEAIEIAGEKGRTVFFIGNGGSASTASHYANDINIGTRAVDHPHFKAISLTDNVALMTALANDEGYNRIFSRQLEGAMQPGDVVIALSVSGNSENIIEAIEFAKANGALTIGISGFEGGKLDELADITLNIPTHHGEYGPVEDVFSIVGHLIYSFLKMDRRSKADIFHVHPYVFENRSMP